MEELGVWIHRAGSVPGKGWKGFGSLIFCLPAGLPLGKRCSFASVLPAFIPAPLPHPFLGLGGRMGFISFPPLPLALRWWGAGPVENVHIDPTAVKGERLHWCGAWRIGKPSSGEVVPPPSLPGL